MHNKIGAPTCRQGGGCFATQKPISFLCVVLLLYCQSISNCRGGDRNLNRDQVRGAGGEGRQKKMNDMMKASQEGVYMTGPI